MENLAIGIVFFVLFILFCLGGILASVFWMQTSSEAIAKITDKTKKFLWWYGFLFFIFVLAVIAFSFVFVMAIFVVNNLGL